MACTKGLQTSMKDKLGRWRYCRRVMTDTKAVCGEGQMKRDFKLHPELGKDHGEQVGDAFKGVEIANMRHTVCFCSVRRL